RRRGRRSAAWPASSHRSSSRRSPRRSGTSRRLVRFSIVSRSVADALERVRKATAAKRRADEEYRAALLAARDQLEGAPDAWARTAAAADTSRQAMRQQVWRWWRQ